MNCYCDGDRPSVVRVSTHNARKPHRCCECGRTIQPGERYENVWGIWSGSQDTFKTCHVCISLREYVTEHVPCFCWNYANMRAEAIETLREYSGELPGLFFGGARLYVQANRLRVDP